MESGLANFEVRVLGVGFARFLRCDPLGQNISLGWLKSPQRFNPYSYCLNRPVILEDPSGMDAWVRAFGALQALGGATEAVAGAGFATGTAVTGVGLVAGGAVALHGADTFVAGMRQLATGEHASTLTAAGVTKVTGSERAGALVDVGIGFVGTGGLAIAGKFAQAGKVVSLIETGEVAAKGIAPAKRASGSTVLGHYPEYANMADTLGHRRFDIPTSIWDKMTDAQHWTANQKFLDRTISRGDDVLLSTPLDKVKPGSYFERELQYLQSKGFRPNADGTRMIPGGGN